MDVKKAVSLRVIGVIILVWLLSRVALGDVHALLRNAHWTLIWAALFFTLLQSLVKFIRYQYILIQQSVRLPFMKTVQISMAAMYLSFITPGRVGEIAKAFFIHKSQAVPLKRLLAGSILDRLYDVYVLIFTALVGIGFVIKPSGSGSTMLILTLVGIALAPLLMFVPVVRHVCLSCISWLPGKVQKTRRLYDQLNDFMKELDLLMSWRLLWGLGFTVCAYLIFFYACTLMARSVGVSLSFYKMAFIVAWVNIASFLPISFAGIGTREACLVYFFAQEGLTSEAALAYSAVMFVLSYVIFGMIGFGALMTLKSIGDPRKDLKG